MKAVSPIKCLRADKNFKELPATARLGLKNFLISFLV